MPHDVFISYSSHDKAVADATCAALEAGKIRCWIAPRDVLAGTEYGESILNAIEGCRAMVLVFSDHANKSPHIRREVERAVSKGKVIVPFRIEDVVPSGALEYCLGNTHWLDALNPPLETRIGELAGCVSRLLDRPENTATAAAQPQSITAMPETESQRFARLFAERPDVIAEIEAEASRTPAQAVAQFERLLLRLEVRVCEPRPPSWTSPEDRAHRERLLKLISQHDAHFDEAKAFVAANRRCDAMYGEWLKQATEEQRQSMHSVGEQERQSGYHEWRQRLDSYQRAIGENGQIRDAIVELGAAALPLVCVAFQQFSSSDAHHATCSQFDHTWRTEVELAKVMSRLKDFRALSFLAIAILRHEDEMNGHHDWGLSIVRAVQGFGVNRKIVDECFERLIGISASEILREKRDRDAR